MCDNKLIWFHSSFDVKESTGENQTKSFDVTIIERENHNTLFNKTIEKDIFILFKRIMKQDKYALQFIEHSFLREAAILKIKQSPHKPIRNSLDPKVWRSENEYYLGD